MVLEEPRPSVTLISERPPEFSILLLAIVLIFPQLKGFAAPCHGMR